MSIYIVTLLFAPKSMKHIYSNDLNLWPLQIDNGRGWGVWATLHPLQWRSGEWWRMNLANLIIQIDSHVSFFIGWWGVLLLSPEKNWILKNLFVESLVCSSMSLSYPSFSSYDFHSYDCTRVKCSSLGSLYTPNQVLQLQVTTKIFCRPCFCREIKKGWVPLFA